MELKTIFAGVPGYELQAWQKEYGNENQNESIKNLFVNKTPVLPFELRSFNVTWSFKEGTKDDSYGGIYVFGIPDAEKLIVLSVDIILDTKPMNITPSYTGPNSIVNTKTPVISADIADIERGEIKPDGTSVWLDGEDVSGLSQISIAITQNSKLQDGYWMGTVELTPTALAEGGHEITIISEDFTGNLAEESWAFTVDTKAPEPVTWLDEVTYTNQDIFELRGTSETDATVSALLGATPVEVKRDTVGAFWANLNLEDGSNQVLLTAADAAGNAARQILTIIKDTEAPTFEKLICQAGTLTNRQNTVLSGKMSEAGTLTINGDPTSINNDGTFDKFIVLSGGTNTYGLQFTDLAGNNVARWFNVTLDTQAPAITVKDHESTVKEQDFNLTGTTEASATLKVNGKLVQVGSGGGFNKLLQLSPGQNAIVIESKDAAGNVNQVYLTIAYDATGTNFGAIGLMVVLLVLGLLLGILFSKYLPWFGAKPEAAGEVKEGEEIKAEEGVEPEEEKESPEPEEGEEAGAEPEVPEEVEETKEPEAEAEPIPKEEGLPKELPSEDEKVAKIEKAYKEGKISKETYEKNLAKFKKKE